MDSNLRELINLFSKLPSIGHRSATRIVIGLIRNKMLMGQLGNQLTHAATQLNHCKNCGNITSDDICSICSNENRRNGTLCIVEEIEDLWAIEKSGCFNGLYHVLGGTLSALKGITPDELRIKNLNQRLKDENIT